MLHRRFRTNFFVKLLG